MGSPSKSFASLTLPGGVIVAEVQRTSDGELSRPGSTPCHNRRGDAIPGKEFTQNKVFEVTGFEPARFFLWPRRAAASFRRE